MRHLPRRIVTLLRGQPRDGSQIRIHALVTPLLRGHRRQMVGICACAVAGGIAEAGMLVVLARVAFALTSSSEAVIVDLGPVTMHLSVTELLAVAAVLVLLRGALQVAQTIAGASLATAVNTQSRKSLFRLYLAASWSLHSREREGALQALMTVYAGYSSGAVFALTSMATSMLYLVAMLATAVVVNPFAALGVALGAAAIGLMLRPLRALLRRRSARAADANLTLATGLTEVASSLQEVRVFNVERAVDRKISSLTDRAAALGLRTSIVGGLIPAFYQGVAFLLVIGALGVAYASGTSRIASLGAVVLIMLRTLTYAQSVQTSLQGLNEAAPYLEMLRTEEARYRISAVPRGGDALDHIGAVDFDRVSFEYDPGQPVLHDVTFHVPAGEIVGIVGPSGAGKSTLVQLLLRLRDPTAGRILVDGRDVRELALDSWYDRVAFVPQDARFFAGTLADNIRFYRDDVDQAAVERAAKLAHIHDDIVSWDLGYDTPVGERGGQLSGGQRQRVCIARALVGEPDIVVFDEPTSALDVKSEALMRETMAELAPRKTVVVIAHRLSTLRICDRIMVILGGRLEGFDTSERLEADNPFYREALQLSGMR